jgi:Periplasmic copper-binding protein (NosD)
MTSIRLILGLIVFLFVVVLSLCKTSSKDAPENSQSVSKNSSLRVANFGAVGDGIHDDGPAITAAFHAAKMDGIPSTVLFEKKIYRLGDNPTAWHYFQLLGHEDLVIEGGGATLLCPEGNLTFYFENCRNITVRGFTFDTITPSFTQGEVVAMDGNGTFDVKIMEGYPAPPSEAFLTANGYEAHGGGGRHMIVFEKGGGVRNTHMGSDHLYINNITRISPDAFRFHVKEDYLPRMKGLAVGNWISYGFNKVNLTKSVVVAKDKSASTYAQISANRVENISFEKLDFFGSLNGGIRISDMPGDVTLREVRIIRKPGSRNLLSTPSDALHLMNIRGKLLIENCEIEAPGDDCLNVGTLLERIVAISKDDPKVMTLGTTDNRYYYYTILKGDHLQFLDTKTKREVGIVTVEKVEFDPKRRCHRIVIDRSLPAIDPASVLVLNLNQMSTSTVIRNNVMKPFMRNALLVRAQHMSIEDNKLDGTHGGVMGINFTTSMGECARLRDINIFHNTIGGFQSAGILTGNTYRDQQGVLDARDFAITNNMFEVGLTKTIRIRGVKNLSLTGNRFEKNGKAVEPTARGVEISDCTDGQLKDK